MKTLTKILIALGFLLTLTVGCQLIADNNQAPKGLPFDRTMIEFRLTGRFNEWRNGVQHAAWDLALPVNTPLKTTMAGEVQVMSDDTSGTYILIENGDWRIGYLHLSRVIVKELYKGYIERGQTIAYSGNTGLSTGPHVHYFIEHFDGKKWIRMNPNNFQ